MDEFSIGFLITVLLILVLLSAFFSSSETAMMALNRYRLKHLAQSGHKGAILSQKLIEKPEKLLGTILLGNNLVNMARSGNFCHHRPTNIWRCSGCNCNIFNDYCNFSFCGSPAKNNSGYAPRENRLPCCPGFDRSGGFVCSSGLFHQHAWAIHH